MLKKSVIVATIFVSTIATAGFAKEIAVFDIRRPLSFENGVDLPKDFYVNAGIEVGLKVGMTVAVNRRQTLYDPFQNKSPGDLIIPVGRLRIIHVQDNIAVARMENMLSREALPTLDIDTIMVGDRLDMATAKMSAGKRADSNDAEKKPGEGEATSASYSIDSDPSATAPAIVPMPLKEASPRDESNAPAEPRSSATQPVASFALPTDGPTL